MSATTNGIQLGMPPRMTQFGSPWRETRAYITPRLGAAGIRSSAGSAAGASVAATGCSKLTAARGFFVSGTIMAVPGAGRAEGVEKAAESIGPSAQRCFRPARPHMHRSEIEPRPCSRDAISKSQVSQHCCSFAGAFVRGAAAANLTFLPRICMQQPTAHGRKYFRQAGVSGQTGACRHPARRRRLIILKQAVSLAESLWDGGGKPYIQPGSRAPPAS